MKHKSMFQFGYLRKECNVYQTLAPPETYILYQCAKSAENWKSRYFKSEGCQENPDNRPISFKCAKSALR